MSEAEPGVPGDDSGAGARLDGMGESPIREYRAAVEATEDAVRRHTGRTPSPRLRRHVVRLDDGHEVSVAVAGHGVPFVVVHGYGAEGFLYAQSLSRLVALGFKVVAIDTAGHGGTEVLPDAEFDFDAYTELLARALDHLGIRHAVLAGHSMGGRIVASLAAEEPDRALAALLVDPILGRPWDRVVALARVFPPVLGVLGAMILVDTLSTFPWVRDRTQAAKLVRLLTPTVLRHVRQPWRLLAPAVAILRSGSSRSILDRLRRHAVATVVIQGERDYVVPLAAARDAAERAGGDLVIVHQGTHSWMLKDPETLPAVVEVLVDGALGEAVSEALAEHGISDEGTIEEIERAFYDRDARIVGLTPALRFDGSDAEERTPRYRFSHVDLDTDADAGVDADSDGGAGRRGAA